MALSKYEQQRFHELFKKGWSMEDIRKQIKKELDEQRINFEDMFGGMPGNMSAESVNDALNRIKKRKKKDV